MNMNGVPTTGALETIQLKSSEYMAMQHIEPQHSDF